MTSLPVDKSPERIRRMFDAIAPRYDLINHVLSFGIDLAWRKCAAQELIHSQTIEGDILDVCCGTGDLSLAFVKQQQQYKIARTNYGIDFSSEMVALAHRKARRYRTLHLSVGDALALPFEENRFALVAAAFGLRNVHDTQKGLAEMVRTCKPDGTVAILDFSMPTLPIFRHVYQFYFCLLLPRLGHWIAKDHHRAYDYFKESVQQFDYPEQLVERMKQLGIIDVQMKPLTFGIATLTWGRKEGR